jgi:hypothetical protein
MELSDKRPRNQLPIDMRAIQDQCGVDAGGRDNAENMTVDDGVRGLWKMMTSCPA